MKYPVEYLPTDVLQELQLERLADVTKRLYESVPHYKKTMDELGVKPDDIKSMDDLSIFYYGYIALYIIFERSFIFVKLFIF